jgi:hypothetical protein
VIKHAKQRHIRKSSGGMIANANEVGQFDCLLD